MFSSGCSVGCSPSAGVSSPEGGIGSVSEGRDSSWEGLSSVWGVSFCSSEYDSVVDSPSAAKPVIKAPVSVVFLASIFLESKIKILSRFICEAHWRY